MQRLKILIGISAFFIFSILCAFGIDREQFGMLFTLYTLLFGAYLYLLKFSSSLRFSNILVLAILFRLPFLFSTPELSDDVYRFIWDGRLMSEQINPYEFSPTDLPDEMKLKIDRDGELFSRLNSKQYYSVYTPLNQGLFWIVDLLSTSRLKSSIFWYHLIYILVDVMAIVLMQKILLQLSMPRSRIMWYAFNPLLIIEATGNLHVEGLVLCFLLAALAFFRNKFAALFFYAAALLKLVPIIFTPLALLSRNWRHYVLVGIAPVLILLSLFLFSGDAGFWKSLQLYFSNFEFNASLYYVLRSIGFAIKGYNMIHIIGPSLAISFFITAILIVLYKRQPLELKTVIQRASWIILAYLLMSTTVHPWYLIPLLGITILAGYRFGVIWSYLIFLSYSHYNQGLFQEHYGFIALEYLLLLGVIILEFNPKLRARLAY